MDVVVLPRLASRVRVVRRWVSAVTQGVAWPIWMGVAAFALAAPSAHAAADAARAAAGSSAAPAASTKPSAPPADAALACRGTIYLTFDTGNMAVAELVAEVLKRNGVRATFFLANEKTFRGDHALDPSWSAFWKARVAEGHAFGSHTFDHVYFRGDAPAGRVRVQPEFGSAAGRVADWDEAQYCGELRRVDARFTAMTGSHLDAIWRAPGGKVSARLLSFGQHCGMRHVGWSAAGFLGDELASDRHPNAALLARALDGLRGGDITMAHLGIWSRRDPWAPAVLEPLVRGLRARGYCFATLREHPDFRAQARTRAFAPAS